MRGRSTALAGGVAIATLVALTGCFGRPIRTVELQTMSFESDLAPIDGDIELCVSADLRRRQWNVRRHPYRVDLGRRASLNVERLARAAFDDVLVDFMGPCGAQTDRPWLTAKIVSANRDWDGATGFFSSEPVDTGLAMSFALHADDGRELWQATVSAKTRSAEHGQFVRGRADKGSRDFGVVLADVLRLGYEALLTAPEVRAAFVGDTLAP